MAELDAIYCYPVKSLRGAARKIAKVELIGLEDDRRWLVVDASGRFQTIRNCRRWCRSRSKRSRTASFCAMQRPERVSSAPRGKGRPKGV
jgi:uncharacterized protein YcbX